MARCAILLRGINIGPNNRIPMAELRSLLTQDGFGEVATYLQSGNVLLSSSLSPEAAADPKRYQVTFLESAPAPDIAARLAAAATPEERFAVIGREIYAWHPEGIARSRLATLLAGRGFKVAATARNWITVTALLSMTAA